MKKIMEYTHILTEEIISRLRIYLFDKFYMKKEWVLVYQMGKVGSSSIYQSIKKKQHAIHIHRMNPNNIKEVLFEHEKKGIKRKNFERFGILLNSKLNKTNKEIKIISPIREPIERNISAYFQNLSKFYNDKYAYKKIETKNLIKNFLKNYNHNVPLEWFDKEILEVFDLDVYSKSFDIKNKYQILEKDNIKLFIFRIDLDDKKIENLLSSFLGKPIELFSKNVGYDKKYKEAYKDFNNNIELPINYINKMKSSKFMNHFYSKSEIEAIEKKWLKI